MQIVESIDVDVPVTTAYNQWTQFESFPQFMDEVVSIRQVDDTNLVWTIKVAGAERTFDAVVTEQHPDERVAWTSTEGELQHAGVVTFHKLADSETRVTVQLDWEPHGFLEKTGSLLGVGQHAVKHDLKKFKEFIEKVPGETGSWRGDVPR